MTFWWNKILRSLHDETNMPQYPMRNSNSHVPQWTFSMKANPRCWYFNRGTCTCLNVVLTASCAICTLSLRAININVVTLISRHRPSEKITAVSTKGGRFPPLPDVLWIYKQIDNVQKENAATPTAAIVLMFYRNVLCGDIDCQARTWPSWCKQYVRFSEHF